MYALLPRSQVDFRKEIGYFESRLVRFSSQRVVSNFLVLVVFCHQCIMRIAAFKYEAILAKVRMSRLFVSNSLTPTRPAQRCEACGLTGFISDDDKRKHWKMEEEGRR